MSEKNKTLIIIVSIIAGVILIIALAFIWSNNDSNQTPGEPPVKQEGSGDKNMEKPDDDLGDEGEEVSEAKSEENSGHQDEAPREEEDTGHHQDERDGDSQTTSRLPDDWKNLTAAEKTDRNPYDCDLATQFVRNDNGQCLSKGKTLLTFKNQSADGSGEDTVYEVGVSPVSDGSKNLLECRPLSALDILGQETLAFIEEERPELEKNVRRIADARAKQSYFPNTSSINKHRDVAEKLILIHDYSQNYSNPSSLKKEVEIDAVLKLLNNSQECSFNLEVINAGTAIWYANGCDDFELSDIGLNTRSQASHSYGALAINRRGLSDHLQDSSLNSETYACTMALWSLEKGETAFNDPIYLLVSDGATITHLSFLQDQPVKTVLVPLQ